MHLRLVPSWDLVMQEGREWKCARALSLVLAESGAARSSSWHSNGVCSGSGSSCNKIKFLARTEYLGLLVATEVFSPDQLCCAPFGTVPGSWASRLVLQPFQPLLKSLCPFLMLFCSAELSAARIRGLWLRTLTDIRVEWNTYITLTSGMKPDIGALLDMELVTLGHLLHG